MVALIASFCVAKLLIYLFIVLLVMTSPSR